MRRGNEGVRRRNHFPGDAQRLQGGDQSNGAIGKQRQVLDAKVVAQRLFQLLVKRATIGQNFVGPDFFEVGNELFQRRKVGLGDVNGLWHSRYILLI